MARRGNELREHILFVAKDVFLEMGFERTSMDVIAARAATSKRTLYAHFENKENLFLAVIDLVRDLFLSKLKTPADYPGEAEDALVFFCGRFLEVLLFARTIRMCRLLVGETERFAQGSAGHFEVIFSTAHERLSDYLKERFDLSGEKSSQEAQELLGQVIHPRFLRALFGLEELSEQLDEESIRPDFDLEPVRKAVAQLMKSLT